jgi:DNA invertase Pin-like site-specific DNA recombinase
MTTIGYARVSTDGQSIAAQTEAFARLRLRQDIRGEDQRCL